MASTLKTTLTLNDQNFNAKLSSATSKAQASLKQIQQSTRGLNGVLGQLGNQIGGLTGQLGGLLNSAKMLANPWVAAGAAITGAGVAFFNYNKNLEETLHRTQQFTNLTGNELKSLRNGIAATARTFGKEFNDVLSSVDGLMSQFGISGETALQIIKDGFVAGANESGAFLQNLSKYSGAFNDIGISADELTALLAQTRSGIFSEEGMDAIQMAAKNIRTMSNSAKQSLAAIGISGDDMIRKLNSGQMTTMQAIRQISAALKKLPAQSKVVGDVLQDIFGKKGATAGLQLISALSEISTNLDEVKQQTGEDGKVMDELTDTTREFMNACQSLFGVTDSGFSHLTDQLKIQVMKALTNVINRFIDLYNKSILVRGAIAAISTVFEMLWTVAKSVLKGMLDGFEGFARVVKDLLELDFDKIPGDIKNAYKSLAQDFNISKLGKDLGDSLRDGIQEGLNGKIIEVKTEKPDESEYGKSGGKGGSTTLKGKQDSSKSGNKSDKDKKDKFAAGSLTDLEKQLKDLQDKYKGGLLKITPEDYQKQVNDLETKIRQKKIELGIEFKYSADTIEGIEERIKKLQENQSSADISLHLDTKEYNKKLADLTKQLQDKKISVLTELDENSLSILEQKLKNLEENQISENVYLHIDSEEYKKQHKELTRQIESERIKLGVSLSLDDTDKQFTELMNDYRKKSSFEMAVGPEKINSQDYEGQLQYIQQQMDENDQLLEQLKELQNAYKELGEAGQYGYSMIESQIANVTAEQQKLGESAVKTNELSKKQKNLTKNLNESSDALGNFGSMLSSMGDETEDPALNIAGTVMQGIANIVLGASQAIAEAGTMGPIGWIAAGLGIMAQMAVMISQIHSLTGYSQGGRIGGGSYVGDKQIIRVNSGEMIFNNSQQSRLWRLVNGSEQMQMQPAYSSGQVEFKIKGDSLVGCLNNYNRKKSKI